MYETVKLRQHHMGGEGGRRRADWKVAPFLRILFIVSVGWTNRVFYYGGCVCVCVYLAFDDNADEEDAEETQRDPLMLF